MQYDKQSGIPITNFLITKEITGYMGVKITELVSGRPVEFSELNNKVLAVDAFNMLYQFITTIRQPDGSPLTDSSGNVTSHLVGLFYRTTNLLKQNMHLVFVFDGESHALKKDERERRAKLKSEASIKYERAKKEEDIDAMKKYASRTAKLSQDMIEESKEFLTALGIPIIQAPGEGEAQAAHIVSKGDAFAVVSQDADSLLFGAKRIVRNLSISQRRKKTGKIGHNKVLPEIVLYDDVVSKLGITKEQLIVLGILVGTDFNIGGIHGIGPKKALNFVKNYNEKWEELFSDVDWKFDSDWRDVYNLFKNPAVIDDYKIEWNNPDSKKIKKILVENHGFSEERVNSVLTELEAKTESNQKGLGEFF